MDYDFDISFHKAQDELFFGKESKFKIISKGRRFGLTRGMAQYVIDRALEKQEQILWVDTTHSNIVRYIERYFLPVLNQYPKQLWDWKKTASQMNIRMINADDEIEETIIDFRSSDRPENIEGFGYSLVILNEAGIILRNKRLWLESIRPMMLDYRADAIIGGTPKGKRWKGEDHLFYELAEKCKTEKRWKYYNFSTYDNNLLVKEEIEELEGELPEYLRRQEIYGEFIEEAESEIIKRAWWQKCEYGEWQFEKNIGIYQSWDTAFKAKEENDYCVCGTWVVTKSYYYLIHTFRQRLEFPELKRKFIELYEKFNPRQVFVEDKASGQSLIQEIERETRIPIKAIKVDKDKIARVNLITPLYEAGKIKIVSDEMTETVVSETSEFPSGEFDDIVDMISQFLNEMKGKVSTATKGKVIHRRRIKRTRLIK